MPTIQISEWARERIDLLRGFTQLEDAEVIDQLLEKAQVIRAEPVSAEERVEVFGVYEGERIEALFDPRTHAVTITHGPASVPRRKYKSPSGAAKAVVEAIKPGRVNPHRNGWNWWRLQSNGRHLQSIRHSGRAV